MLSPLVIPSRPTALKVAKGPIFERGAALTLCALPAIYAALTFQTQPDPQMAMRSLAIPVRIAEAMIVLFAMLDGFSTPEAWGRLNQITRWAAAVWAACVVLAAAFAPYDPGTAIILAAGTLLHGLVALALFDRFQQRNCAGSLLIAAAWGLAGYAVVAASCAILLRDETDFPWFYFGVGVSNVRQIGFYGLPLIGIVLGWLGARRRADMGVPLFLPLAAGIFLVCWSGGRAALGAAVVCFAVSLAIAEPRARWRIVVVSAAAAACVFPLVQALSFDPLWGFNSLHRVVPQAGVGTIDQYSSSRVQFWQWTWQDIVSRPWIGHGEGQFGWMISDRTGTFYNHPHNVVLQMLYEWGALGFCAVAMLVRPVLWRLRDMDRSSLRRASAHICGLVALASMAILDGSLYYALPVLFALLFLTGLAAAQQPPAPEEIIGSCGEAAAS